MGALLAIYRLFNSPVWDLKVSISLGRHLLAMGHIILTSDPDEFLQISITAQAYGERAQERLADA